MGWLRDLPIKFYLLCGLLLGVLIALPPLLLVPVQSANQIISQGAVATAVITDSYTITGNRTRVENVQFSFTDSEGRLIHGSESRMLTSFAERWNTGSTIPVHYSGGSYLLGNVLPDGLYVFMLMFTLAIPTLLWSIITALRDVPRARDEYESVVLRPQLKPLTFDFNPVSGRSEVVGTEIGIKLKDYERLQHSASDRRFIPTALSMVCASLTCAVMLSQLTVASPSPDEHLLTLTLTGMVLSLACLLFAGWSHRLYLRGLVPEVEDEIERRRGLIVVHRQ